MNNEEFRLLLDLSMYQDGVSKKEYIFKKWLYCGDSAADVEKAFGKTYAGLNAMGLAEHVAPPYFNHLCSEKPTLCNDKAYVKISHHLIHPPSSQDSMFDETSTILCIGECLYRITTKGSELLLGIHLLNGGEKEWMRILDVREQFGSAGLLDEMR